VLGTVFENKGDPMKCVICKKNEAEKKSIVCSENCQNIRLIIHKLLDKYTPRHGCENCFGDLHQGCTEKCREELQKGMEFSGELWKLIKMVLNCT